MGATDGWLVVRMQLDALCHLPAGVFADGGGIWGEGGVVLTARKTYHR